jgi:hypothetical protein
VAGPPPATAAVRVAVRRAIADLTPGAPVTAAVSGGADSLALAAALAFVRPGSAAVVVDHRLQDGSAAAAGRAAEQCAGLGLSACVMTVAVAGRGEGPARDARLAALAATGATVLLGHTLDDQAETVLLGLARGSGSRSLAGMAAGRSGDRCSRCPGRWSAWLAGSRGSRHGRTRTTATPRTPACGCGRRRSPRSKRPSGPVSQRRWHDPPLPFARTPTRSMPLPRPPRPTMWRCCRRCRQRSGRAC